MNAIVTHLPRPSSHIGAKYGAGKGNRTPILSLEGSLDPAQATEIPSSCDDIRGRFTPNNINALQERRHSFLIGVTPEDLQRQEDAA